MNTWARGGQSFPLAGLPMWVLELRVQIQTRKCPIIFTKNTTISQPYLDFTWLRHKPTFHITPQSDIWHKADVFKCNPTPSVCQLKRILKLAHFVGDVGRVGTCGDTICHIQGKFTGYYTFIKCVAGGCLRFALETQRCLLVFRYWIDR